MAQELLAEKKARRTINIEQPINPPTPEEVEELLSPVEGLDDVKEVIKYAVTSLDPVHVLLIGPPATGKSLILHCLERLPGALFIAGYRASKAGLQEAVLRYRPRYLLIDEIDKMRRCDMDALINLMEEGRIVIDLRHEHIEARIRVWVIATANRPSLPAYIFSRFEPFIIKMQPYSRDELVRIATKAMSRLEGVPEELARFVVERMVDISPDMRAIRNLIRAVKSLSNDPEKAMRVADRLIEIVRRRHIGRYTIPTL